MKKLLLAAFFFLLTACGEKVETASETSSLVYKGGKWPNASNIPVCIMNPGEVSQELRDDIKNFVTNDYAKKTAIRFTGWGECTAQQKSQAVIRLYYRRVHNWDGNGGSAGGGLSWLGPVARDCGKDCGGGTMYVAIGTRGSYPSSGLRQFAIDQTRATAVHEFGHAIGLAHEQDRADAPQCGGIKGNTQNSSSYAFVGNYDPQSIMNYCKSGNLNTLSAGDVGGIAYLYGAGGGGGGGSQNPPPTNNPNPGDGNTQIPSIPKGNFGFVNANANRCLDIDAWSKENMAPAIIWDCGQKQANQSFRVLDVGGGYFNLQSVHSGKCLDVSGGSTNNGAALVQYNCHQGDNQKFAFKASGDSLRLMIKHSGKCVDIRGASKAGGAIVQQSDCNDNASQRFRSFAQ